jgi:hypothetical protein
MFRNREEAARRLAAKLKERELHDPLVLAIPQHRLVRAEVDLTRQRIGFYTLRRRAPDQQPW